jgi:hypothetical protein
VHAGNSAQAVSESITRRATSTGQVLPLLLDPYYQFTLDAVYLYVVPWSELPIVPSYPRYPHQSITRRTTSTGKVLPHGSSIGSWEEAVSYERGTPVTGSIRQCVHGEDPRYKSWCFTSECTDRLQAKAVSDLCGN